MWFAAKRGYLEGSSNPRNPICLHLSQKIINVTKHWFWDPPKQKQLSIIPDVKPGVPEGDLEPGKTNIGDWEVSLTGKLYSFRSCVQA